MRHLRRLVLAVGFVAALSGGARAETFETGLTAYRTGDFVRAFRIWLSQSELDDPRSQAGLAFLFYRGLGVILDYREAAYWAARGAEQGQAEAQALLGTLYNEGKGVPKNKVLALTWCELSLTNGSTVASGCRNSAIQSLSQAELKEAFGLVTAWFSRHPRGEYRP